MAEFQVMTLAERRERARLLFEQVQNLVEQLQDNRNGNELWIELEETVGQAQEAKRQDVMDEREMVEVWDQLFDRDLRVARIIILGVELVFRRKEPSRIVIRRT